LPNYGKEEGHILEANIQTASNLPQRKLWKVSSTLGVIVLFLVVFALVGIFIPTSMRLGVWIITLFLLSLLLLVVGQVITGDWLGFLIDNRQKMSLARLQLGLWLLLIGSAYLAAVLTNFHILLFNTSVNALSITIPPEILALFGVSATSLAGASVILNTKNTMPQQQIHIKNSRDEAEWYDMFKGDDAANSDYVDLSKVQMFYFTIILVLIYGVALGIMFMGVGEGVNLKTLAISAFPALSATMVTLLGISQAGYLAYKAVPRTQMNKPDQQAGTANPALQDSSTQVN
jgi:hypothetical protein